jgi:hypothetical protein
MEISLAHQLISFAGALLILIAYIGHQVHRMNPRGVLYNWLNALGSAILGWMALHPFQLGFVILEFAWVVVSMYGWYAGVQERKAAAVAS